MDECDLFLKLIMTQVVICDDCKNFGMKSFVCRNEKCCGDCVALHNVE
jgi:hypothetical protein